MATDPDAIKIANDSGFPLQIAIGHQVADSKDTHGWTVRHSEHAWTNRFDQQSGFIDLVLQDRYKTTYLVLECKRVRQAAWLFMHPNGTAQPRRHAKCWVTHYAKGKMPHYGWCDVPIDPVSPEAMFCAIRGQSVNDRTTLLERVGGELVSATEALAEEERDFRPPTYPTARFYFNVIVTTADLKVAKFNPQDVSLADGTFGHAEIESVPFVRLRKQLSMRPVRLTPEDFQNNTQTADSKENTVFVLRADSLLKFLKEFDYPASSLRQFQ